MLNVLLDGISIFDTYKIGIGVFFITLIGFGLLTTINLANDALDIKIRLLASFGLGSTILGLISYALILLAHFWPPALQIGSFTTLFAAVFIILKEFWLGKFGGIHDTRFILTGAVLFLLSIARLSFLKHITLPSYSDSPIHYQIIRGLLKPELSGDSKLSLENIYINYYHFGFHGLAAWLISITNFEVENVISLLGQLFLVIAPASVLFLTYVITKDIHGALFAGLLAAIGWNMPAFAVNWGKFPALGSLAEAPAVLAYLGLYLQGNTKKPSTFFFGLALLIGIFLMHTRIIICIFLAAIAYFFSIKLQFAEKDGFSRPLRLSVLYIISLWPLSQVLIDFYAKLPVSIILLALLPFAFKGYPRLAAGIFFYTFGLWLLTLAPALIDKNAGGLLDIQFLEIMLYIPFSITGGAGFAGLLKSMPPARVLRWGVVAIFMGGAIFNFMQGDSLYPNPCCDYFKEGDRLAFQWIQESTSEHSLILISTFDNDGKIVGTDAGIWIAPLIGKYTNKFPFNTNWETLDISSKVCNSGAKDIYIYMGGREYSFVNAQLIRTKWIKQVYQSGATVIYQVSGCPHKHSQ